VPCASSSSGPTLPDAALGVVDATVLGVGSMLGAGIFAALAPAAAAAGRWLLLGLLVAAAVATCNALSSAQLAAVHPESGGAYVYGRRQLGRWWGWTAGWSFITGKLASCVAMALTFGRYVAPSFATPLAVAAVVAVTAVNLAGVRKTTAATKIIVAVVLTALAGVLAAAVVAEGSAPAGSASAVVPLDVLRAAGLLFFAFAGYARVATLGEEVVDPRRTIPRALLGALAIALLIYAVVAVAALAALGPTRLAASDAPLVAVVDAGELSSLRPLVKVGAAVAALGALLSLTVGLSRTVFAMASTGDLPNGLAAVHPRRAVPHRAEAAVAVAVLALVAVADLAEAIAVSSFAVLTYYAIANAAAYTLRAEQRRWPRLVAVLGVAGCALLGASLPPAAIAAGLAALAVGLVVYGVRRVRAA
jgi:APA family basic amino acid/polyamine antiporter